MGMDNELLIAEVVSWSNHHITSRCRVWVGVDPADEDTPIQLFFGADEQVRLEMPRARAEEVRAKLGTTLDALDAADKPTGNGAAAHTGSGES